MGDQQSQTKFRIKGLSTVEGAHPGEFVKVPAGGYVCVIRMVGIDKTKTGKYKMMFTLDIAEGEFAGAFKDSQYPPIFQQLIYDDNGTASKYLKGLLEDIEASNPDWKMPPNDELDVATLVNKKVGFIFGEKEYLKKNGEVGTFMEPRRSLTIKRVRNGEYATPQLRKLSDEDRQRANGADTNSDIEFIQDDNGDNAPF